MISPRLLLAVWLAAAPGVSAAEKVPAAETPGKKIERWPAAVKEITYPSRADNTPQPALFYAPADAAPKPLLVALHSWSGDYRQTSQVPHAEWCLANGWAFIHPNFRGPNNRPEACGSELAVEDILSAVAHVRQTTAIDPRRIYLTGSSGGGYATLLLAGRAPDLWAAVSAWVPITDLQAWHTESLAKKQKYAQDIEKACGGAPVPGSPAAAEARKRSALTYLAAARPLKVAINVGIHDGHTGSVPVSHSLHAFNVLADPADRLSPAEIDHFTRKATVPTHLAGQAPEDPWHGKKQVLFRRESHHVRLTVFDGGHEGIAPAALHWLAAQRKP